MTIQGADGRTLSPRGLETRAKLLEAAEQVFGELGYHDASIVKVTEAAGVGQGTFYLYFASKQEIFDELIRDLNRRVRHAMKEASSRGETRLESELLGFGAYFRFTADHPALYRIIRQAEFVSPQMLEYHYEKLAEGYVDGLRESIARGEVGDIDPEVTAWALMAAGEMLGMRYILWGDGSVPEHVEAELARIIRQAEFVSPEMLRYHYDKLSEGYVEGLREAMEHGELGDIDPEVSAWSLMATGELLGMRYILWGDGQVPARVEQELARIVRCVLEAR